MPIKTTITFKDHFGNVIEETEFSPQQEAAKEVARFVEINADEDWQEAGAQKPGPNSYSVEVSYGSRPQRTSR